jgi:hypothetical protein
VAVAVTVILNVNSIKETKKRVDSVPNYKFNKEEIYSIAVKNKIKNLQVSKELLIK